jgi:hypothetical protein
MERGDKEHETWNESLPPPPKKISLQEKLTYKIAIM